jgi:heterodisulfide reductase subunit B
MEVRMSRFAYFPGCSLHATAREYDESIRALAETLDFGLEEIGDWCCCGATPAHAIDAESARLLGLWNLGQASLVGKAPLLTGCAACFSRLRAVQTEAREQPALAEEARDRLGLCLDPNIEVLHIAQVLAAEPVRERLRAAVVRPLGGLPVACYYGCLLTRPRGPGAVDDAEDPHLLEDLVRLVGGESVAWPLRLDCCGASMSLPRPDVVHALSGKILEMAHARGARAMVVACPLCHSNLDFQQSAIRRKLGLDFRLPILYLTQLIGLALGLPAERLGLQRHFVPVRVEDLMPAVGASRV